METTPERLVTMRQAELILGCTRPTVRRLVRCGELPVAVDITDRRRRLIDVADLMTLERIRPAGPIRRRPRGSGDTT